MWFKSMNSIRILILGLVLGATVVAQKHEWQKFIALETSRAEVEKLLGKPEKYFETFGVYETDFGKFNVWFSTGRCDKHRKDLQYKIKPQLLTQLHVTFRNSFSLEDFVWDIKSFTKYKPLPHDDRIHFSSADNTLGYVIGHRDDGSEFLFEATIQPGRDKEKFLCEEARGIF